MSRILTTCPAEPLPPPTGTNDLPATRTMNSRHTAVPCAGRATATPASMRRGAHRERRREWPSWPRHLVARFEEIANFPTRSSGPPDAARPRQPPRRTVARSTPPTSPPPKPASASSTAGRARAKAQAEADANQWLTTTLAENERHRAQHQATLDAQWRWPPRQRPRDPVLPTVDAALADRRPPIAVVGLDGAAISLAVAVLSVSDVPDRMLHPHRRRQPLVGAPVEDRDQRLVPPVGGRAHPRGREARVRRRPRARHRPHRRAGSLHRRRRPRGRLDPAGVARPVARTPTPRTSSTSPPRTSSSAPPVPRGHSSLSTSSTAPSCGRSEPPSPRPPSPPFPDDAAAHLPVAANRPRRVGGSAASQAPEAQDRRRSDRDPRGRGTRPRFGRTGTPRRDRAHGTRPDHARAVYRPVGDEQRAHPARRPGGRHRDHGTHPYPAPSADGLPRSGGHCRTGGPRPPRRGGHGARDRGGR